MKLKDVLDQIKAENNVETNGELSRIIDIDTRRVGEYYAGSRTPTDDDYVRIALASGFRVDELQGMVKLEKTKDETTRALWAKYSKSIGRIAAAIFLTVLLSVTFIVTTPSQALAFTAEKTADLSIIQIMRAGGRWLRMLNAFVRRVLDTFFPRFGFAY